MNFQTNYHSKGKSEVTDYRDQDKRVRFSRESKSRQDPITGSSRSLQRITEEDIENTSYETSKKNSSIILT